LQPKGRSGRGAAHKIKKALETVHTDWLPRSFQAGQEAGRPREVAGHLGQDRDFGSRLAFDRAESTVNRPGRVVPKATRDCSDRGLTREIGIFRPKDRGGDG
jgi:hypothetical protein